MFLFPNRISRYPNHSSIKPCKPSSLRVAWYGSFFKIRKSLVAIHKTLESGIGFFSITFQYFGKLTQSSSEQQSVYKPFGGGTGPADSAKHSLIKGMGIGFVIFLPFY